MIAVVSTDNFRFIGTNKALSDFKGKLPEGLECDQLDAEATPGFLSVQFKQDPEAGTTEIKQQPIYWENAAERFAEYFPNGMKTRKTPLPHAIRLVEADPGEIEEAKALSYRQVIGVLQYAVTCTKPACKYAVSELSQFLKGWSTLRFGMALRVLEFGYNTRRKGIMYTRMVKVTTLSMRMLVLAPTLSHHYRGARGSRWRRRRTPRRWRQKLKRRSTPAQTL
jgi:hypothetical protein